MNGYLSMDSYDRRVRCSSRIISFFFRANQIWASMAGMVFRMIARSSHKLLSRAYWMSSCIISVKVVRFLPLTCHNPVSPGNVLNRSRCHGR